MSQGLPRPLFVQVSNKALFIHVFIKEVHGVNASWKEALFLPPPQAGPIPNPQVQVQNYSKWQDLNLSQRTVLVHSFSDLLSCAYESPGDFVKMQIQIQGVWAGA